MSEPDTVDLQAELAALRAENDALRTRAVAPDEVAPATRSRGGWWRALLSALCIVIADDPRAGLDRRRLGSRAAGRRGRVRRDPRPAGGRPRGAGDDHRRVDGGDQRPGRLRGDHRERVRRHRRASACRRGPPTRSQLLEAPAANGLESLVTTTVTRVVESDAFSEVWATATRAAHRALVGVCHLRRRRPRRPDRRGRRHPARRRRRARQAEPDRSRPRRRAADPDDRQGHHPRRRREPRDDPHELRARERRSGYWLPFITLALFGLGILIARRRSVAVLGTGIGFAIGAGALAIVARRSATTAVGIAAGVARPLARRPRTSSTSSWSAT